MRHQARWLFVLAKTRGTPPAQAALSMCPAGTSRGKSSSAKCCRRIQTSRRGGNLLCVFLELGLNSLFFRFPASLAQSFVELRQKLRTVSSFYIKETHQVGMMLNGLLPGFLVPLAYLSFPLNQDETP